MDFKKYLLIILIIFVFFSSYVNAAEMADSIECDLDSRDLEDSQLALELDDSIDEESLLSNPDDGNFTDLQNLISNADNGSTLDLDRDYSYSDGDSSEGIVIGKSITINGNGATLDGVYSSRIFLVGNESVKTTIILKNIIFINGYSEFGGAVKVIGSSKQISLQVNNCTFENNRGGAIYFFDNGGVKSNLNIVNCKFTDNSASIAGGGAVCSLGKSTMISNSIFKGNTAEEGSGGALEIHDEKALSVTNSVFESNTAKYWGGAIDYSSSEPMTISNCNFTSNSARIGGAISLSCYYKNCKILNSIFKSNMAKDSGGAISFQYHATLKNNTFVGNNLPELEIKYPSDFYLKYSSSKNFKVKIVNSLNQKPVSGVKIKLYIKLSNDGKKYKTKVVSATTDKKGVATFKSLTKLSKFSYYGTFHFQKSFSFVNDKGIYGFFNDPVSLNYDDYKVFKISKASTKVKAPKLKVKFKKSRYFKVKITSGKKPVKKIKIKLKIYTGKKYKTYKIKTNKKGIAKFNTKKLKRGSHKVVIQSGNKLYNYKIAGKSRITVR